MCVCVCVCQETGTCSRSLPDFESTVLFSPTLTSVSHDLSLEASTEHGG